MKNLIRKIFKKGGNNSNFEVGNRVPNNISETTDAVFNKYKKSFKDLARYDREGKAPAN
jgi:hypothetical protein